MADYASMRALEVWYDVIRAEDVVNLVYESERGQLRRRIERAEARSSPEFVFPKLAENRGTAPKIRDDPPLIFHPSAKWAPGRAIGFREQVAQYRSSLPDHVRVLLDRYRLCDVAIKVIGIGSVGTVCGIGLFVAADDDPLFLQIKQAKASVLEPYAGESVYPTPGQRVVNGQHLMQSASDIFLGWFTSPNGAQYYVRQLRDTKISAIIEDFDANKLRTYGQLCEWVLAKARDPATQQRFPATWALVRRLTMRSASSRSNTPTRTSATTEPLLRRSERAAPRRQLKREWVGLASNADFGAPNDAQTSATYSTAVFLCEDGRC
jgi:hypothetical protein